MFIKKKIDEMMWGYGFVCREVIKEFELDGDYFRLYTYDDRLSIPIFHVIPVQNYKDIAVCLFEPRFYQYTSDKHIYDNFLVDLFDQFLRRSNIEHPERTNWEQLIEYWKFDHDLDPKYQNIAQPDYTKLEDNKIMRRSLKRALIAKWNA